MTYLGDLTEKTIGICIFFMTMCISPGTSTIFSEKVQRLIILDWLTKYFMPQLEKYMVIQGKIKKNQHYCYYVVHHNQCPL